MLAHLGKWARIGVFSLALFGADFAGASSDSAWIDVGVAWQGESALPERVLAGLRKVLNHSAPRIRLEIRGGQPTQLDLDSALSDFEAHKRAMVVLRDNGALFLGQRGARIPAFVGDTHHPALFRAAHLDSSTQSNITGVTYSIPVRLKLETFRQVYPGLRKILLLVGTDSPENSFDIAETQMVAASLGLSGRIAACATLEEALAAAQGADPDEAILLGSQSLISDNIPALVSAAENRIVFSDSEQGVDQGALAGMVADDDKLGQMLGVMLMEHLIEGKPLTQIPIRTDPEPRVRLNYSAMEKHKDKIPIALRSLAKSEQVLQSVHRSAPSGIGMVANRIIIQVNDYILNLTGYTKDELVGKSARMLYPSAEDFESVGREKYRQIALHGTGIVETRWVRKDGKILDVLLSSTPLNPQDLSAGVVFTVLNISEQVAAKKALRDRTIVFFIGMGLVLFFQGLLILWLVRSLRARRRAAAALQAKTDELNRYFNTALDLLCIATLEGEFLRINKQWELALGYCSEELLGQNYMDFVHPEDIAATLETMGRLDSQEQVLNFTNRYRHRDGSYRYMEWRSHPHDGMVYASARDVTERYLANEALVESENKLRTLFAAVTEMVVLHEVVFDSVGTPINYRITDCNAAFCRVTGILRENAVGRLATEVYHTDIAPYLEEYAAVGRTGTPYAFETYYPDMDRYFAISVVSPGPGRFATITADVTSRQRAQDLIASQKKELEQIVYVASHDLRSPLVNIDGYSREIEFFIKALESGIADDAPSTELLTTVRAELPDSVEALYHIRNSARQMDALLKGLLALSRVGRSALAITALDMNALLKRVVSSLQYQATQQGAEIHIDKLPPCKGDDVQLSQVFSNLLGNALKYASPQRSPRIRITAEGQGHRIKYCVEDNGVGIAETHQGIIFELFHRLDPAKTSGEGLGLTIVRQVLSRLNGEIRVQSQLGVGSRFYVLLPSVRVPTLPQLSEEIREGRS